MLYIKDGRGDARYLNLKHRSPSCLKPRLIIIPDTNHPTRFYIQYTYEQGSKEDYPVQPTQPKLIAPQHYRNIELRDASVYVYTQDQNEIYYGKSCSIFIY